MHDKSTSTLRIARRWHTSFRICINKKKTTPRNQYPKTAYRVCYSKFGFFHNIYLIAPNKPNTAILTLSAICIKEKTWFWHPTEKRDLNNNKKTFFARQQRTTNNTCDVDVDDASPRYSIHLQVAPSQQTNIYCTNVYIYIYIVFKNQTFWKDVRGIQLAGQRTSQKHKLNASIAIFI